jgi:hypothetical protein
MNLAFTLVFVIELITKLIAIGIKQFFKGSYFNVFDALVVLGSIVDIILQFSLE